MIIDRKHRNWAVVTVALTVALGILYWLTFNSEAWPAFNWLRGGPIIPPTNRVGGTPLGLTYGILGLLIFIFAALLGSRRKHPNWNVGLMKTWLRGHIWLTLLTIPLVIFHSGVHLGGPLTQVLLFLYMVVMVSGLLGLAFQQIMPRLMQQVLPEEVVFEQIEHLCNKLVDEAVDAKKELQIQLIEKAEEVSARAGAKNITKDLNAFIDDEVIPYLRFHSKRKSSLARETKSEIIFKSEAQKVPAGLRAPIERLQALCDDRRRMSLQVTMQHWLHGWILFHAPLSLLLIMLTIWHALVAAYVY